jgi:hypothetical protein
VKPDWSREENSLGAFFDAHPEFGHHVRTGVARNLGLVIDLLEEIGLAPASQAPGAHPDHAPPSRRP